MTACERVKVGKKSQRDQGFREGCEYAGKQMRKHRQVWVENGVFRMCRKMKGNPREDTRTHTHPHVRWGDRGICHEAGSVKRLKKPLWWGGGQGRSTGKHASDGAVEQFNPKHNKWTPKCVRLWVRS